MTTTTTISPSRRITDEVTSWPGVEAGPGNRGEFSFKVGRKEIGHLHGDHAAHFGFGKELGAQLRAEGRVGPHPVFPDKVSIAARGIETEEDVRDVIAMMRLNYDRVIARNAGTIAPLPRLHPSALQLLPFDESLAVRAFALERDAGNLLVYSVEGVDPRAAPIAALGGVERQYLTHGHEALFASDVAAPLFVNEADRASVDGRVHVRGSFSKRHTLGDDFEAIPTPGHTPGATAYLWDSGEHRMLFTGDTIYLRDGEWVAAMLGSSDRDAYVESLLLIRELDFDVLVPWAATAGRPYYALTDRSDIQRRIDAIIGRLWDGQDH